MKEIRNQLAEIEMEYGIQLMDGSRNDGKPPEETVEIYSSFEELEKSYYSTQDDRIEKYLLQLVEDDMM